MNVVKEDRMQQRFWKSLSCFGLITLVVICAESAIQSSLTAQEPTEKSVKATKEPVFRVSKLVEDQDQQPQQQQLQPQQQQYSGNSGQIPWPNNDRIANSTSMAPGSVTPGGGGTGPKNILPTKIAPAVLPRAASGMAAGIGAVASPVLTPAVAVVAAPKKAAGPAPHPLDQAVEIAQSSLAQMQSSIVDYTAILAKREAIKGVLGSPTYMKVKFRNPRQLADGTVNPFSIYMKFLKPRANAGREVIWVEGQNNNNLLVHEPKGTPLVGNRTFSLSPTGFMAMKGQRYPVYKAGLENLVTNLIEKAERDRAAGPCVCDYREGANINKRPCSCIELVHPERRAPFEFHKAQVFIDDELNVPVRYVAYDWPATPGGEPPLIEEYTYYNIKVNVGLTDLDFDTSNPAYSFPRRR